MNLELSDKVALITGASQGMGRATAEAFAAEGAKVAIAARTRATISSVGEQIKAKYKADVFAEAVDVTDVNATQQFVRAAEERFGRIDICVANAGGPPAQQFAQTNLDDWQKAFELNFRSVVALAHAVLPGMQRRKWGRFITIT